MSYTEDKLTHRQLLEARERFAELLQKCDTKEIMWQQLFTECPYITIKEFTSKTFAPRYSTFRKDWTK